MTSDHTPLTLTQKILRRASGAACVDVGEIVTVQVDLAFGTDLSGNLWREKLEELQATLWNPDKVILVNDHFAPGFDLQSVAMLGRLRAFARDYGVRNFHDLEGISHVLLVEKGYLRPGMLIAGGDSHTPMAGAFGCLAIGFGATDMVGIAATGRTWLQVPSTLKVRLEGTLPPFVTAKDAMLLLCRELGMNNAATVVEYGGAAVAEMDMLERLVLTNMAAELGCDSGIIAPDQNTARFVPAQGESMSGDWAVWHSDPDADFSAVREFDMSSLAPQVAAPHSPSNSAAVDEFAGVAVHQVYIGACVGAKIDDLRRAATILKGRRVAAGTRLLVAPASRGTTDAAARDGTLATLLEAGATLLPTGCGACAALGAGVLDGGEVCISTTNRNFKGRMGHRESLVYLASAYTCAASAVYGHIADPRELVDWPVGK